MVCSAWEGINSVVEQVQSYVFTPIRSKHLFREVNVKPSRGFLLVGSMGAGKTQLGLGFYSCRGQTSGTQSILRHISAAAQGC